MGRLGLGQCRFRRQHDQDRGPGPGTDGHLNVWGADLPGPAAHTVLPERTSRPPALTPWGDELALAWTGNDRRLNVAHLPRPA